MRIFVFSIVIFCLIVAAVVANGIYVRSITEELRSLAGAAYEKSAPSDSLGALVEKWDRHKPFLCLSASLREIDSATEYLLKLEDAVSRGDRGAARQSYLLFCNALRDIERYEELTPENIL